MLEPPKDRSPGWNRDPEDESKRRYWDGEAWAPSPSLRPLSNSSPSESTGSDATQTVEPTSLALSLGFIGAALVGLGLFLPRFESTVFSTIADNSLIQSAQGLILAGVALAAAFATYRFSQGEGRRFSVLGLGLFIVIAAFILGTGSQLELQSIDGGNNPIVETASPGIGIYTVGIGGSLIAIGGIMLAGFAVEGVQPRKMKKTRQCPSCAETILVEAKVCKHCGRDVEQAASAN